MLAKVLSNSGGDNSFSAAVFNVEDACVLLQRSAGLAAGPEANKFLFQLAFGKPVDEIGTVFKGDTKWVDQFS